MKSNFFVVILCLSIASMSYAQTSESSTETAQSKTGLSKAIGQKKFEDDSVITDAKLKAEEGSRSRYSMKFNLSFSGPPVGDLNNSKRPNPDSAVGTYDTSIGGAISARYRLSSTSAMSVGSGVTALTPIQGVKRYDMNNPFLGYDVSSKWNDIQLRNAFSGTMVTNPDYRAVGETAGVTAKNYAVYNIKDTGFALEFDSEFSYYFFERNYLKKDRNAGTYFLNFYPYVKYNASDKLNFNTSLAIQFVNPRAPNDPSILNNRTITQQLALGYAFTKDIYFSPYIGFIPASLTAATTTVNFSTTFSLL